MENRRAGGAGPGEPALAPLDAVGKRRLDAWVTAEMAYHHAICDGLETIADQLPVRVDPALVAVLLEVVERSWTDHIRAHRELVALLTSAGSRMPELALLASEHPQICGVNDEVVEQLSLLTRGEAVDPNALGYILRAAFESRRRHLAWERAILLRLANGVLVKEARGQLARWCAARLEPAVPLELLVRTAARPSYAHI